MVGWFGLPSGGWSYHGAAVAVAVAVAAALGRAGGELGHHTAALDGERAGQVAHCGLPKTAQSAPGKDAWGLKTCAVLILVRLNFLVAKIHAAFASWA